jgi:peptidoglycan/xylan/chitin deacetylase (PgdA/CDA1 family)
MELLKGVHLKIREWAMYSNASCRQHEKVTKKAPMVKILYIFLLGVLQISLTSAEAAARFIDISGEWEVTEEAGLTYRLGDKSDTRHEKRVDRITIKQKGGHISYCHPSGGMRMGGVTEAGVVFKGVASAPRETVIPVTITENTFEGIGKIKTYQTRMRLRGVRRIGGKIADREGEEHPFLIISRSVSLFRRTGFALTFDDGPVPGRTDRIVSILKKYKVNGEPVRAGFFMVGDPNIFYFMPEIWVSKGSVRDNNEIVRRVAEAGHIVGNHTHHHARFLFWRIFGFESEEDFIKDEIMSGDSELERAMGTRPVKIFRPPYLQNRDSVKRAAMDLGFNIIRGETVGDSQPFVTIEEVNRTALAKLKEWDREEPCVLIFHDGRPTTYENLSNTLDFLQSQGFRLCHFDPENLPLKMRTTQRQD